MPHSAPSNQPLTVFISYAHESDALLVSVAALAEWLGGHGCRVFTDHPYIDRPPPEGWQAWMLGCIEEADTVLVVCTPKLKGRYEKTAAPDAGRGATYEGAIVTQRIYDDAMRNTKFFPILLDGGTENDIPTALKSWWNGHRFPGGNEGIRRMVFAHPSAPVAMGIPRSAVQRPHPRLGGSALPTSAWRLGCSGLPVPCRTSRRCKARWPANSRGLRLRRARPRWCSGSPHVPPGRHWISS